jgi:seryl-tRNA synthetase
LLEIIKRDFLQGLKTFKFWAEVLSQRVKIELNVLKLISEINKLSLKRDLFLKSIGKEIYESWNENLNIKESENISSLIRQIREIEAQIEDRKKKLSELEDLSRWKF